MKTNKKENNVENKKNKKLYWIIGIIIEIVIICVIICFKFLNKPYDKIIECSIKNSTNNGYTMEIKEAFYIKDNKSIKQKRIINYYFQYEEIYLEFKDKLKENTVSPKINGYTIKINDKKDYTEQIIYEFDLNKMKKDTKNVKIVDNTLKFKEESGEEVSINQLNEEEILSQYKELGYTCK